MGYSFITSCVNADGDSINEMVSISDSFSSEQFLRIAKKEGFLEEILDSFDYHSLGEAVGKTPRQALRDDWSVNFAKSFYQGVPCVYMQHSRIEHIYMDDSIRFKPLSKTELSERAAVIDSLNESFVNENNSTTAATNIKKFLLDNIKELEEHRIPASALFAYSHGYGDNFKKILSAFDKRIANTYENESTSLSR